MDYCTVQCIFPKYKKTLTIHPKLYQHMQKYLMSVVSLLKNIEEVAKFIIGNKFS
jgi:hypothetical protein